MTTLLIIVHVIICIVLILAVLLQSGKAADLAGAFGGAGSQTAFGPRSRQTILSKITTVCAVLFMLTSIGLWILSGKTSSVAKDIPVQPAAAETQKKTEEKAPSSQTPSDETNKVATQSEQTKTDQVQTDQTRK
ncbi:MAG TPA: preprotein translocase subunit SecG [Candidatus Saccharicenans sp.]|nr:preprotein translocase subunit SecG [Candidatus Saccharicenans sp.]HRD02708.1 preprotein translocase subunit SecG [Candidatus Saccharicenans sp.]